jgi:hypothetical protein
VYNKASWLGKRSRLHDLVELLKPPHQPNANVVRQAIDHIPADAWTQYPRTQAYLSREFALAGFELPPGQPAVLKCEVDYRGGGIITGYGPQLTDRINVTGVFTRMDKRFGWSLEVRYQLAPGMNPQEYVPVRKVKSELGFRLGGPTPPMGTLTAKAWGSPWTSDGPVYYNVKRGANSISIHDNPGVDKKTATVITENPGSYPIRFCAMFQMSLFKVVPGGNLQGNIVTGEELPGSKVGFHFNLWRDSDQVPPRGNFMLQ